MSSSYSTTHKNKTLLAIPPQAQELHSRIVSALLELEHADFKDCLDIEFIDKYYDTLDLFSTYQKVIISNSEYTLTCKRGCSDCCYHWVEDVNSFEAEIIANYLRKHYPDRTDSIVRQCREDEQLLEKIEKITFDKLETHDEQAEIDRIDLVLAVYYQMKRKCPLLLENGTCSVYSVRPLTCRIYMSFSESSFCNPDYQDQENISTYLLNLEEDASTILDRLHFRYQKFKDDTGLRSLLIKYLSDM